MADALSIRGRGVYKDRSDFRRQPSRRRCDGYIIFRGTRINGHGTANCQSALPVFDGNIRKRPMALANEGAGNAFVTCDSESISNFATGFSAVAIGFYNRAGAADVEVSCTLVNGVLFGEGYFPKTVAVAAAGVNLVQ